MKPCKWWTAERHNRREKALDYTRKDLESLNTYKEWIPISEQMQRIRKEYLKVTGQKLQPAARPIQEIVLVVDWNTTAAQVEHFCDLLKELGMTPLSYAIHKDEGHYDSTSRVWIPNLHAHIIVDTTCWEHKEVIRTKKSNGKTVFNPETHLPLKVTVDGYAKTIKFSPKDMELMQVYAAKATGLKRGDPSNVKHKNALQYKIEAMEKEIKVKQLILDSKEKAITDSIENLSRQALEVVSTFDDITTQLKKRYGIEIAPKYTDCRNRLDSLAGNLQRTPETLTRLMKAITELSSANAIMSAEISSSLSNVIKSKLQSLKEISNQIEEKSLLKSSKGALLSLIGKPADKQAKKLLSDLGDITSEKALLSKENENLRKEVARLEREKSWLQEQDQKHNKLISVMEKSYDNQKENSQSLWARLLNTAKSLITHSTEEQLRQFEAIGLIEIIGQDVWKEAMKAKSRLNNAFQEKPH